MEYSWTVDGPQWFLVQRPRVPGLAMDSRLPEVIFLLAPNRFPKDIVQIPIYRQSYRLPIFSLID